MADSRVAMQSTYSIPGYALYGKSFENSFTLRPMTTMEEKLRVSSPGFETIAQIIQKCLISPEVDVKKLKMFDVQFLMYKMRIVTYGEGYKLSGKCPHCGGQIDTEIDLDALKVREVPEGFKEPFEIGPLPVSKDVLQCKIFTLQDYLDILRESKEKLEKFPEMKEDPSFIIELSKRILTVNGKTLVPFQMVKYLEELHARDYQYFDSKYLEKANSFGLDLNVEMECGHCNKKIAYPLPMTSEFFRPTY